MRDNLSYMGEEVVWSVGYDILENDGRWHPNLVLGQWDTEITLIASTFSHYL